MMKLYVRKLHEKAITPCYAHENDAGLDLFSIEECVIDPGESKLIRTGIAIQLPPNTEAQVRPRSGLALHYGITLLNTPGTIDEGYRGEIGVIVINHGKNAFTVEPGMKIAQMVINSIVKAHVQVVRSLPDSERGEGGFGSSGL